MTYGNLTGGNPNPEQVSGLVSIVSGYVTVLSGEIHIASGQITLLGTQISGAITNITSAVFGVTVSNTPLPVNVSGQVITVSGTLLTSGVWPTGISTHLSILTSGTDTTVLASSLVRLGAVLVNRAISGGNVWLGASGQVATTSGNWLSGLGVLLFPNDKLIIQGREHLVARCSVSGEVIIIAEET